MKPPCASLLLLLAVVGCRPTADTMTEGPNVQRILQDDRFDWITVEADALHIHFPSGSYAGAHRSSLPARAAESRRAVLSRLSVPGYGEPFHVFYVDDRKDMEVLTGSPVTGFAYPDDHAVVLVFNDRWRAFERHELTHVVTLGSWSRPAGPAVVEGLATYVDGTCGGYENGRVVRTVLDQGSLLPLETLAGEFRQQDDLIAYLQAASLVEYVVHLQGPGAIAALWDQGLGAAPTLLQTSPGDFFAGYSSWLISTYDPVPPGAWQAIRQSGCGIDAHSAK